MGNTRKSPLTMFLFCSFLGYGDGAPFRSAVPPSTRTARRLASLSTAHHSAMATTSRGSLQLRSRELGVLNLATSSACGAIGGTDLCTSNGSKNQPSPKKFRQCIPPPWQDRRGVRPFPTTALCEFLKEGFVHDQQIVISPDLRCAGILIFHWRAGFPILVGSTASNRSRRRVSARRLRTRLPHGAVRLHS